ncbi:MAG: glycosyltransferase family 4 protein [Microcystaceae cyanobacterium]
MKVLLLSTYDIFQGAARATYRLHRGLQQMGVESWLLVHKKFSDDPSVLAPRSAKEMAIAQMRARIAQLPLQFYPKRTASYFSPQWLPDRLAHQIQALNPDVINVHWTQAGFMQLESLAKFQKPIVLTLHDLWPLTGGCHYTEGCDRYQTGCGQCPQLGSSRNLDLSSWIWQRKAKAWRNLDLTVVALSQWVADCVQKSPILQKYPLRLIPNGLDSAQYYPVDKILAKKLLGLDPDRRVIAFGALQASSDRRKGFPFLEQILQQLRQTPWGDQIELLIFGASQTPASPRFPLPTRYLGHLSDDLSLRLVYSAADVFLAPSLEDNLPNTVLEAIACGTPCIAFRIGGMPDLIQHQGSGYLAEPFVIEDFVQGIQWVLANRTTLALSPQGRERFTLESQAQAYRQLFAEKTNL